MTKTEVIEAIAQSIAKMEGFHVSGSLSERNANPGNIRVWRDSRGTYPTFKGYVDFIEWSSDRNRDIDRDTIAEMGLAEGWRVLRTLVGQYLDGKYGKPNPTFLDVFSTYAPATDGNKPLEYATFVASKFGATPYQRISDLIQG